ncbi:MAG: Wzz/FepE/Etk N-terminal domain-containing protein [Candidatus Omnitrophica bacterium]|nr:Wzz/FepE/Etk N-terminal domain-containing protein [Candidatus Omnitrophota bacterium]
MFDDEIDLLDYIRIIIKRKITILSFFIIFLFIAAALVYLPRPFYEASSIVHVGSIDRSLMTVADAERLLKENRFSIASSLEPSSIISAAHLMRMYDSGKITIKEDIDANFLKITLLDKDKLLAMNICEAIVNMLNAEGNKIYNKERLIVNRQVRDYVIERAFINQQITLLKECLSMQDLVSYVKLLQEIKYFYKKKYEPLTNKVSYLKNALERSQDFWIIGVDSCVKEQKKLNFDQVLAILGLGLLLGIVFSFSQEFRRNNFRKAQ